MSLFHFCPSMQEMVIWVSSVPGRMTPSLQVSVASQVPKSQATSMLGSVAGKEHLSQGTHSPTSRHTPSLQVVLMVRTRSPEKQNPGSQVKDALFCSRVYSALATPA